MGGVATPLTSVSAYKTAIQYSASDRDAVYSALISEVSEAIETKVLPNVLPSTSFSDVFDAPADPILVLEPRPVKLSTLQIWRNSSSKGDPALFTSDHLLTLYTDYKVEKKDPSGVYSLDGRIRCLTGPWGVGHERAPGNLAHATTPGRAALKVSYTAGYSPIPGGVVRAVHLVVSMLFIRRNMGVLLTSESLNGFSWSGTPLFPMAAALNSPDVRSLLDPYIPRPMA